MLSRLSAFILILFFTNLSVVHALPWKKNPGDIASNVKARSALLIDSQTREILFQRNVTDAHPPASTTKLLTALLVYELKGLGGVVHITVDDTRVEPSSVPLIAGETVAVRDLFYSLLLGSDNDSARALARYAGGSLDHFVDLMNARALALGCHHTHFVNPNGLPSPGQYTCAEDLLKIFEAAIAVPDIRSICSTEFYILRTAAKTQRLKNHNRLLGRYDGMGPAKTGWTHAARHTYAASATRNGNELHLVLLYSTDKWTDATALFDYGFAKDKGKSNAASPLLKN